MTVKELVSELQNLGYDLYLDGENIRYRFHALVDPPKERTAVLLDSLKRNKPEVILYLRNNERPDKPLSSHETGLTIHCSWIKNDVPASECHKPKSCFHRDEHDRPVECMHLKAFTRQRNRELGLNEAVND